jgi:hypothetical protein
LFGHETAEVRARGLSGSQEKVGSCPNKILALFYDGIRLESLRKYVKTQPKDARLKGFYDSVTQCKKMILLDFIHQLSTLSRLGDAVVSALTTGPKGRGFEPGQGNGF